MKIHQFLILYLKIECIKQIRNTIFFTRNQVDLKEKKDNTKIELRLSSEDEKSDARDGLIVRGFKTFFETKDRQKFLWS